MVEPGFSTEKRAKTVPKIRFTDLTVRSLKEGLHFDDKLPAFGIRIGKNRKTWLVVRQPNRTKVKLGYFPALSLADARTAAHKALGTPYAPQTVPTFPDALTEFLEQDRWRAKPRYNLEKALRKHFTWTKQLDKITHQDVLAAIEAVETPGARSNAIKEIRTFFNWCVPRYLPSSPANHIAKPSYIPRQRIFSDDEIRRLWKAADIIGHPFGTIVQLALATGARRGELVALKPEWIHEDRIVLPASAVKNSREHAFPIGPFTKNLIKLPLTHSGWSKSKERLDRLSGVQNYVLHDCRRTLVSRWADFASLPTIERYINHVSGSFAGIVGVYQHNTLWADQVRAVEEWERRLMALLGSS